MNKIRNDLISALIDAGASRQTIEALRHASIPTLIQAYQLQRQITKIASENEEIKIQLALRSRQP